MTLSPLVLSSAFFLIPAIYAQMINKTGLSICSLINCIISTMYWSNPVEGIIRSLDLLASNLSFFIFAYYGFRGAYQKIDRLKNREYDSLIRDIILAMILSATLYSSYKMSCWLYHIDDPNWVVYHFFFHIQTVYLQTKSIEYAA